MPHAAVHKSKEKKRKGAAGAEQEYARRLQSLDENEDVSIGRITKRLHTDRFMIAFYDLDKKQTVEVQANIVDRNIQRLRPDVGNYIIPVKQGSKFEIFLVLTDEDARRRSKRIPRNILNISFTGDSANANANDNDYGIEFEETGMPDPEEESGTQEERKAKKEKVSKHTARVIREENDTDDVDVDEI